MPKIAGLFTKNLMIIHTFRFKPPRRGILFKAFFFLHSIYIILSIKFIIVNLFANSQKSKCFLVIHFKAAVVDLFLISLVLSTSCRLIVASPALHKGNCDALRACGKVLEPHLNSFLPHA